MLKVVIEDENGVIAGIKDIPDGDVSLSIGRHSDCDVLLTGAGISRHHARLHVLGGTAFVEDTGSAAGTFLNDAQVTEM
ncbi:MAG: FHA domain-containing protein, partial [Victivallales bacterium]|nr:FHA domain-containing protein [Victivallales bacterium]